MAPPRIRFDRNELAGSFGDLGTDLPLVIGLILASGLDSASVFVMFGLAQIATGLVYGLPMPVQPLKAMAVLVITQKLSGATFFGAGLAIGATMLLLAGTGVLDRLARLIPRCVVRGIQFGLGLSLGLLALKEYVPSQGLPGLAIAAAGLIVMAALWQNRRFPPALFIVGIGVVYAAATQLELAPILDGVGFTLPTLRAVAWSDVATGFFVLALPQLPLSLANSVIATSQTVSDLFPERKVGVAKLGATYGLMNLVLPFFGGIPACHGCGGLAGHYGMGARTGGSVVIEGAIYAAAGLFFSGVFELVVKVFPLPILGVVLLFEALILLRFIADQAHSSRELTIALLVALMAAGVPHGYLVGTVAGTAIYHASRRWGRLPESGTRALRPLDA